MVTFLPDSERYMSAVTTNRDTFKVRTVLVAPGGFLALVALQNSFKEQSEQ
jgi:hypothetical protein